MDTIFFTRLQYLCSQSAVKDVSGVLRALGLSTSKGTAWKSGAIPKGDILLKLANFFHVSTDYLLGNTDDPTPQGQKESPPQGGEPMYPEWYGKLTPEEIEQVRKYAEFLISERRKDQP